MHVDTVVKNCKIVTNDGVLEACLAIDGGKIASICAEPLLPYADKVVDAQQRFVIPGLVDPHVHLQKAYYSSEHLVRSESRSAVAGGVTTIAAFWFDRDNPYALYKEIFQRDKEMVERNAVADIIFNGMIMSSEQVDEIPHAARDYGITSYKFLMAYKGPEAQLFGSPGCDDGLIYSGMRKIAEIGLPGLCMVHTENMEIIDHFKEETVKTGRKDLAAWSDARPWFAEEENVVRAIYFASITGAPLYIVHHSGCNRGSGIEIIAKAKREGVNITVETCPHYLALTKDDNSIGALGKFNPPLKDKETVGKLWLAIKTGIIDCIGSDHATIMPRDEKMKSDIWSAIPGGVGTETILPVMLSEGVNKGRISLERLVQVCCTNTAKSLGVYPRKGTIEIGSDADLVVIDLKKEMTVTIDKLHSAAGYSPYEGRSLKGWPILAMVRGKIVMQDRDVIGESGTGRYIPRHFQKELG